MSSEAELKQLLAQVMARLETVTARLEKLEGGKAEAPAAAPAAEADDVPKAQQAFLDWIEEYIKPQTAKAAEFDEALGKCMNDFQSIAMDEADFIGMAAKSKKPAQDAFQKLLMPISQKMMAIGDYKNKNFKSPYINYINAICEAVQIFGWICVEKTPAPFVADNIPSAEFYTNKILVATKGKEQDKYDWALNFVKGLKELVPYIKNYHTTGLTWNPKGVEASAQAAKPEPPKVEPPKAEPPKPAASKPQANPGALFAQLNQGTGISSGLKHVTADMKTKNMKPEDKVPLKPKEHKVAPKAAAPKQAADKPPKMEKKGTKWDVSYQKDNKTMEIEGDVKDSIYIFKCENSAIKISGKINCISIDSCKKLTLICDTVVSSIEVVNCTSVDIRVIEVTPTITIDKSQSVITHLSKQCLDGVTTLNTSKCDAINISIPNPEDETDELEYPVPEQFYTIVKENKLYPQIYFHDKSSYYFPH